MVTYTLVVMFLCLVKTAFGDDAIILYCLLPKLWGEAKAQREEIQKKKEKDKKEKTKVEFVTGVVRKTQIQAPLVTSTTGVAVPSTSTINQGTGHEEEKKRKSKWDNPAQTLPAPVPLMQRPIITVITTTIPTSTGVSTTTSAAGSKTTVISSDRSD
eukprot:XP_011670638.1 PREDICTED: SAP30-binding protein-like [Strongylocentrotus purpuratus]